MNSPIKESHHIRIGTNNDTSTFTKNSATNWFKSHYIKRGIDFMWTTELEEIYSNCLLSLTGSDSSTLNPKKGLCILGSYGTGKTTLVKSLSDYLHTQRDTFSNDNPHHHIRTFSAREVVRLFQKYGYACMELISYKKQGDGNVPPQGPKTICLDDVGQSEEYAVYFGTKSNVLRELIADRYDIFIKHGIKTHMTSNLTAEMFKDRYGEYISSRMNEMFNIVILNGNDHRKGK